MMPSARRERKRTKNAEELTDAVAFLLTTRVVVLCAEAARQQRQRKCEFLARWHEKKERENLNLPECVSTPPSSSFDAMLPLPQNENRMLSQCFAPSLALATVCAVGKCLIGFRLCAGEKQREENTQYGEKSKSPCDAEWIANIQCVRIPRVRLLLKTRTQSKRSAYHFIIIIIVIVSRENFDSSTSGTAIRSGLDSHFLLRPPKRFVSLSPIGMRSSSLASTSTVLLFSMWYSSYLHSANPTYNSCVEFSLFFNASFVLIHF